MTKIEELLKFKTDGKLNTLEADNLLAEIIIEQQEQIDELEKFQIRVLPDGRVFVPFNQDFTDKNNFIIKK